MKTPEQKKADRKNYWAKYYAEHGDEIRQKAMDRYYRDPEARRAARTRRRLENLPVRLEQERKRYYVERESRLASCRKSQYGITKDEFEELRASQGGVCGICGQPETMRNKITGNLHNLSVDHDHETGIIRGLLCNPCNRAVGWLRDSPTIARQTAEYLERFENARTEE